MLLFNWCGYQLLHTYLEKRAYRQFQLRLDENNYAESELISIKVAADHLSYYNPSGEFESTDGQIEISGLQYNYVKRRLCNDSVEMLCIPNKQVTQLKKITHDFFKLVNDLQQPGRDMQHDSHSHKNFRGDDCTIQELTLMHIENPFFSRLVKRQCHAEKLPAISPFTEERPPEPTV
jgi:hypothetical protein